MTLARLARELSRTADLALQVEMTASESFHIAPAEWQAMDLLVQRLFALRDYVAALSHCEPLHAASVVPLEEMRAALAGVEFRGVTPGDADLF